MVTIYINVSAIHVLQARTEPITKALIADKYFDPSQWYVPEGYAVAATV